MMLTNAAATHAPESIRIQILRESHTLNCLFFLLTPLTFSCLILSYPPLPYLCDLVRSCVWCSENVRRVFFGVFGQQKGRTSIRHATFSESRGGCRELHTKVCKSPLAGAGTSARQLRLGGDGCQRGEARTCQSTKIYP
jgi:hypothetical protein